MCGPVPHLKPLVTFETFGCSCRAGPDTCLALATAPNIQKIVLDDSNLGQFCDKTPEQVLKDAERDFWMDGEEAKAYGIVDGVITNKKKK